MPALDSMTTLTLPLLVAGRDTAVAAVSRLGIIGGRAVLVDARALASATSSFTAQLVRSVLVDARADSLTVLGGPQDFVEDARHAADGLAVSDRLQTAPAEGAATG